MRIIKDSISIGSEYDAREDWFKAFCLTIQLPHAV